MSSNAKRKSLEFINYYEHPAGYSIYTGESPNQLILNPMNKLTKESEFVLNASATGTIES